MINGIVAVEKNHGIGFNGSMPWPRLYNDLRFFKEKTLDQIVVMGRKTWESIGSKPLPNRINLVLSNSTIHGANCFSNKADWLLDYCRIFYPYKEIYIIGGSAVYQHYLPKINKFYITEINQSYECDTFFNMNYIQDNFKNVKELVQYTDPINYTIKEYKK